MRSRSGRRFAISVFVQEVVVHLGLSMWGNEALPTVIRLIVLEAGASIPVSDGAGGPISVIAAQHDEDPEDLRTRLEKQLSRGGVAVGSGCVC